MRYVLLCRICFAHEELAVHTRKHSDLFASKNDGRRRETALEEEEEEVYAL